MEEAGCNQAQGERFMRKAVTFLLLLVIVAGIIFYYYPSYLPPELSPASYYVRHWVDDTVEAIEKRSGRNRSRAQVPCHMKWSG